ncbi:DHHA1 domain-containing protein [Clostridium sp. DSM 100503]|uniref:alanyl-tRNA editing protein n=1 Tax=Clostridium sp. DSM 100503 TaxID=2963282 RepID=UPI00214A262E|nr:DHHA1 domain-containing protein [Clostridium sp. DSM 100503]MCR1951369.1 DHHA1 domain-containing protein [Clostridium sp. DSM 100503]
MEKLYYIDQYLKDFEAKIVGIKKIDSKFHLALDRTAFFPGGGGQVCDLGELNGVKVLDVYEENREIYHVVSEDISDQINVKGKIDWDRREDGMHQHLAQHVLSGCFFKLFNRNTLSIHLGKDISTVDIIGYLTEDQIRKAEKMANEIIRENILVESLVPSEKELENMNLRRDLPNTEEEIRVVKIGDLDINACCGVHPKKTLDLKLIKIRKHEKNKDNTRIEFLAGERAIKDTLFKDKVLKDICNYLSSNEEEALNSIKNLKNNIDGLNNLKRKLEEDLIEYEIENMILNSSKETDLTIITKIFNERSIDYIRKLANRLVDRGNIICLFATINNNKSNILFSCSKELEKVNMGQLLKESIKEIKGKGGGNKILAQGSGENIDIEKYINSIKNKVKENEI